MTATKNIGILLAAIWFILTGLIVLFSFTMTGMAVVMGILAVLAGIFLLVGR
jgi:hypothetical protein